ncbi:rhodanese-like domain-containing protein [Paenibacillus lentus]|uniref:rhodanese-like domain-containing protein n=1 Tax=Paenibacillus lentus TaxID=1338368 RepID=UPI003652E48E
MIWLIVLLLAGIGYLTIRNLLPVKGLAYVDASILNGASGLPQETKMLDVRDEIFYRECHVQGAINISIGRLPFVWRNELSPSEPVLILSDSKIKSKRAARLLKSRGFRQIYAIRGEYCA